MIVWNQGFPFPFIKKGKSLTSSLNVYEAAVKD